ncbi:hypothetical protein GCM10011504_33060 [Siccirubricoccus deserti]|nr:hypothetical protein GCM10011504_33060 [Siccirubricoccus deserti]
MALGVPVAELLGEALPADAVRITRAARRPGEAPGVEALTRGDAPLAAFIVHPGADFAEGA